MTGHYDLTLVAFSFVLSILASWIALDLAGRVHRQSSSRRRLLWLLAGSNAMGIGVWSMHYVGMLAYRMDMPVLYDWPTVAVSLLAAIVASAIALWTVSRPSLGWPHTILGGVFMGSGIALMHYIGMAAMRMPAKTVYSPRIVLLSIIVAIGISVTGLRLTFGAKTVEAGWSLQKAASALVMGIAIPCMHYIGMFAAHQVEGSGEMPLFTLRHTVQISSVSTIGIILVSLLVLSIAVFSAHVDRRISTFRSALHGSALSNSQLREHNERIKGAFRAGGVGIWECDPATGLYYADENQRELYGLPLDDQPVSIEMWNACIVSEDRSAVVTTWQEAFVSGDRFEGEYRINSVIGGAKRVRSIASLLRHPDGAPHRILGMTWDVTAERLREMAVVEQASRFRMTLEAIGDAVISTDDSGRVVFLNRVATELTGWSSQNCVGAPIEQVFQWRNERTDAPHESPAHRCLENGGFLLEEDAILVDRRGSRHNIRVHVALMDTRHAAVICFQDITASRQLKHDLLYSATHDHLTGLPNRAAFERDLSRLWEENRYSSRTHCLCILDLDRFKVINDTSGHLAGDALLREISDAIRRNLQANDLVARMGGDEFMVLLADTTLAESKVPTARLLHEIAAIRFAWKGRIYDVTASLGLVQFDCFSPEPDVLISQADVALFTAKRQGRNQVSTYVTENGTAASDHHEMQIVADLRRSLEEDRFELHAQPIVLTSDVSSTGYYELLLRMCDEKRGVISPGIFIPAAERYGLMPLIDRWVIARALEQYGNFSRVLPNWRFAINLSGESLSNPGLWDFVHEHLERNAVSANVLVFEVTETALINNLQNAQAFMQQARHSGARVALDDFGTGLSSLAYLKLFPLDIIKIDGTFIRKLGDSGTDQAIVRAVTEIAHSLGASTVAECVENFDTIEILRTLGVDHVQGWATGKPVNFERLLADTCASNVGEGEVLSPDLFDPYETKPGFSAWDQTRPTIG